MGGEESISRMIVDFRSQFQSYWPQVHRIGSACLQEMPDHNVDEKLQSSMAMPLTGGVCDKCNCAVYERITSDILQILQLIQGWCQPLD